MRGKTTLVVWLICMAICAIAPSSLAADGDKMSADVPSNAGSLSDCLTRRQWFDFEQGRLVSEVKEVPTNWQKIVTRSDSPEYDRGHPAYNDGWLIPEGSRVDLRSAAMAFCRKIPIMLAKPSLENLQRALLAARSKMIAPLNQYLRLKIYKGKNSYQTCEFVPISRLNSYRLDGKIRTHNYRGIREPVKAWMSILWYKDNKGTICRHADGSPVIFKTIPIESETGDEWRDMRLLFNRTPYDANYVKIRVTVEGVSTTAEVDFDDIVLTQEPQVLLEFSKMPALFFGDEKSFLNVELGGLPDGQYAEDIVIEDISQGGPALVRRNKIRFAIAGGANSLTDRKIDIAVGRRGVFRLKYNLVLADGQTELLVASREIVFARAVAPVPFIERGRYGATMDFFATPYPAAFDYARYAGTSPLKTTLWGPDSSDNINARTLERMLKQMRRNSIMTTGIISPLSSSRAAGLGISSAGSLYAIFKQPSANAEKAWYDFVREKSTTWSEYLSHVQLGEDFDSSIVDTGLYSDIEKKFRAILPPPLDGARMALPMRGLSDKPLPAGEYMVYYVGADVPADVLQRRLEAMRDISERLWVTLEPPAVYDPAETQAQIAQMVRKIVLCRRYNVRSVIIPLVASVSKKNALLSYKARPDETLDINPLAVAMLNVASVLERAHFEDEFVSNKARVTVFRKNDKFIAMLYSDTPEVSAQMYWGGGLVAYDAMGNLRKISIENNMARIDGIGPVPIFVDNIDVGVARTWHSIRVDTPAIVSRVEPQTVTMSLKNNFDKPISGVVNLKIPEELQHLVVRYMPQPFELKPGEVWNSGKQLQLSPSVADSLGGKEFEVSAEIRVEGGSMHVLKKTLKVKLVSDKLSLDCTGVTLGEDGYLVLHLKVRNDNSRRISSNMYIKVENGSIDRKVSILRLGTGAARLAEIRLPYTPADLPGKIWIGLREIGGRQFANLYIDPADIERLAKD